MAKKSALNLLISKTCVALVNGMSGWKQTSRTRLANFLASVTWYVLARRRKIALTNLRLCFPEWSEQKRLDAGGIAMNTIVRGASLYQTQSNPVWDKWAFDARKRFSDPVLIPKSNSAMKEVIRALRASLPFYYLPDMDHGARNSVFVPFFGVQAATLPMVSKLAKLTGAKVIWGIAETTPEGYVMHLSKPLENFPTSDATADTLRLNQELEQFILKHPDQYLWTHRRFKTRPEGEPSVY